MRELVKEPYIAERDYERGVVNDIQKQIEQLSQDDINKIHDKVELLSPEVRRLVEEEERDYLALLFKKDQTTFNHSLSVAETARLQLDEFGEDLDKDNISREAFLRAALFHDVGKLGLPDSVLKGTMSQRDFKARFFELRNADPDFINQRLLERGLMPPGSGIENMSEDEIRDMDQNYRDYITLSQCFSGDEEKLKEIRSYNIDPKQTSFMDVLKLHEGMSKQLILQMDSLPDKSLVAEFAGAHHKYSKAQDEQFPEAKEILRVSVEAEELVHLADVYQAIRQKRSYKRRYSNVEALYIIMKETEKGAFQPDIAKRWISRVLPIIDRVSEEEQLKYEELKHFLETKVDSVSSAV